MGFYYAFAKADSQPIKVIVLLRTKKAACQEAALASISLKL
ncbi:MAG: hypothetical protein OSB51_04730 [Dokdonia donghaensis]|nr:hypothetical protein [Dokdonia donghaensis]